MKRTRHQYHYAVRCCKKNKLKIQKEKLAKNISHTKDFWKELKKINHTNKITTEVMDDVYGNENITTLFLEKYKTLYNSVLFLLIIILSRLKYKMLLIEGYHMTNLIDLE